MKQCLILIIYLFALMLSLHAKIAFGKPSKQKSTEGHIKISGHVPVCLDLNVIDIVKTTDFKNLGQTKYKEKTVGVVVINSNSPEGFALKISSKNHGKLVRSSRGQVSPLSSNDQIKYSMTLQHQGGRVPTTMRSKQELKDLPLEKPLTLSFPSGRNPKPVKDLTYAVKLSVGKENLAAGTYSDTVTFELSAL